LLKILHGNGIKLRREVGGRGGDVSIQVAVLRANRDISRARCHEKLQERHVWSIWNSVKNNLQE